MCETKRNFWRGAASAGPFKETRVLLFGFGPSFISELHSKSVKQLQVEGGKKAGGGIMTGCSKRLPDPGSSNRICLLFDRPPRSRRRCKPPSGWCRRELADTRSRSTARGRTAASPGAAKPRPPRPCLFPASALLCSRLALRKNSQTWSCRKAGILIKVRARLTSTYTPKRESEESRSSESSVRVCGCGCGCDVQPRSASTV